MNYVLFATAQTNRSQAEIVAALQAAYDAGAAGFFHTRAVPGGFDISFEREIGDDENILADRIPMGTAASEYAPFLIAQICDELQSSSLLSEADSADTPTDFIHAIYNEIIPQMKINAWAPFPQALWERIAQVHHARRHKATSYQAQA